MQRRHTHIIAERAAIFASFDNCGQLAEQAARFYASQLYNHGSSGANAIAKGVKMAQRLKRIGTAQHG